MHTAPCRDTSLGDDTLLVEEYPFDFIARGGLAGNFVHQRDESFDQHLQKKTLMH